jgi:cobalt-zinc-cadmium efflux system membrane fusion protein
MNELSSPPDAGRRQTVAAWKGVTVAIVILVAAGLWWISRRATTADEPAAVATSRSAQLSPEAQRAAGIAVAPAGTATSRSRVQAAAVLGLDETRTARIGSIVDGVIVDLSVQVGDRVARGAVLGTMHSHLVHEALAAYKKAQAEQRRQETELAYATDAEARAERLFNTKALSRQEVDRARTDRAGATEAVAIARSELERSAEELEHLGLNPADSGSAALVEWIPIRAPIAGVVLERLVSSGSAVTPGTPLFVVSDLSRLWAVAEVDETQLPHLEAGRPTELTVAAYPDRRFDGRILAIGDTIHESTRRVSVRVAVPNPDRRLKPEMLASIDLGLGDDRQVVVVPVAALQTIGRDTVVFVQNGDGQFQPRPVVVAAERHGQAELREGLQAGERVVTAGGFLLKSTLASTSAPQ